MQIASFLKVPLLFVLTLPFITSCSNRSEDARFEVAHNGIYGGMLSNLGRYAVIGSILNGGSLWRISDKERLFNWNHTQGTYSEIVAADIDASLQWALTAEVHTLVLWDLRSGSAARFWTSPGEVLDAKLSQGARYALLGQSDHSAVLFNVIEGGVVRTFPHQGRVRSVDISEDNQYALTGSDDESAVLWRLSSGEKIMTMPHGGEVNLVKMSSSGRLVFSAAKYDRAIVWDVANQKALVELPLSKEHLRRGLEISSARFSSDDKQLLLGYFNRNIELWNIEGKKITKIATWKPSKRHRWQPTGVSIVDISFTENGNEFLALGSNGFVYELSFERP